MTKKILFFCLFGSFLIAENCLAQTINLNLKNEPITTAFAQIESQTNYKIAYNNDILPTAKIYTLQEQQLTLNQAFDLLLSESDLKYEIIGQQILIVKKAYFEIFGIVKDATYKEALTAVMVYVKGTNYGVTTNDYGYYSLRLLEGDYTIVVNYLGMKPQQFQVKLSERKRLNVELEANEFGLAEVVIKEHLQGKEDANSPINQQAILSLAQNPPRVGGEPDLLHILRAKAGVQSSAGGIGGLYVRGGNSGHNLILLDGVPVYNAMHLIGMNSIFSPNAVRGVQFYTSKFSARYGGRLASVMDVQSKEGNPEKFSGLFGVNPQSVHGQFSGKLFNSKGSFWISGRHSFALTYIRNVLQETFYPLGNSLLFPKYYDFNIKINQQIGKNDRFYYSYYKGNDEIEGQTSVNLNDSIFRTNQNVLSFGNTISSFRWNHIYNNHLFSNISINRSQFFNQYRFFSSIGSFSSNPTTISIPDDFDFELSEIRSNNEEVSFKADFDWIRDKHQIKFGAAFHAYEFIPFFANYDENSDLIFINADLNIDSLYQQIEEKVTSQYHTAFYGEDEFNINDKLRLRLGLRFTTFSGKKIPFYYHFEPRLALAVHVNKKTNADISISKMVQYLHLVSNADVGLPRDLWLPSDSLYKPATAWHYNLDVQHKFNDKWRLKSAIYYKSMNHLLTLPDTITPVAFGTQITDQVLIGQGNSYGFENTLYFQNEHWTGFGSYTLSWANRLYQGLNENKVFPFQFDARHYLQFIINCKINKHWQTGLRVHWSSPRPILLSNARSLGDGFSVVNFNPPGQRNSTQGLAENRLDFNLVYSKKRKKITNTFNFNIYNVFQSHNPSFYYSDNINDVSSFGLAMPFMISGGYSLEF